MPGCTRRELLGSSALLGLTMTAPVLAAMPTSKPPVARVEPVTDDYFGTKVTDNYRWMENPKDPEWAGYLKGQSDYAHAVLDSIPGRDKLLQRVSQLSGDSTATNAVQPAGGKLFFEQRPVGAANYQALCARAWRHVARPDRSDRDDRGRRARESRLVGGLARRLTCLLRPVEGGVGEQRRPRHGGGDRPSAGGTPAQNAVRQPVLAA